jgi:hypothetical protein
VQLAEAQGEVYEPGDDFHPQAPMGSSFIQPRNRRIVTATPVLMSPGKSSTIPSVSKSRLKSQI